MQALTEFAMGTQPNLNQVNVQMPINDDLNTSAKLNQDKPSETSMLERSADTRALKPTSALSGASSTNMKHILYHKVTESSTESRKKKSVIQFSSPPSKTHFNPGWARDLMKL